MEQKRGQSCSKLMTVNLEVWSILLQALNLEIIFIFLRVITAMEVLMMETLVWNYGEQMELQKELHFLLKLILHFYLETELVDTPVLS